MDKKCSFSLNDNDNICSSSKPVKLKNKIELHHLKFLKLSDNWNVTFHTANVNNSFDHFVPANQGNLQIPKHISTIVIIFLLSETP